MASKMTTKIFIVSAILVLFLAGCGGQDAEIKEWGPGADNARIETIQISAEDDVTEKGPIVQETKKADSNDLKVSSLKIISPKDLEMIKGKDVKIIFEVSDFNLELPNTPVKEGSGYIHIWFDSIERKSADTEAVFRDAGSGRHSIVAELRKSDGTPLIPMVRKSIAINVNNPETEELQKPKLINVEADDFGFYPSPVKVKRNQVIDLNITVRKENVYFNGLDFESNYFETGKIYPGDSKVVQFVSNEDFKITSYWPSTKTRKADLKIVVE